MNGQRIRLRQPLWPPGVRVQLAIWYVIVFAILLLSFGTIFYLQLSSSLSSNLDTDLKIRSQEVQNAVTLQDGELTIRDNSGTFIGIADSDDDDDDKALQNSVDYKQPDLDVDYDAFIRILDAHAHIAYTTPAFSTLIVPSQAIKAALNGTSALITITTRNHQMARLYIEPLKDDGHISGLILTGTSLTPVYSTLSHVVMELLIITPCILILGAIGSYWLASRAFRPIAQLTQTARVIKDGDLHSRVPVPHTNDEVQRLALTFNEMIDHLERTFNNQRRFTADASHELRTPVAAIRSMTDVALQQGEESPILRDVNTQAEHLGHLISDLLTLARADEGHIHFEREQILLDRLASDVAASLEWMALERGLTLEVRAPLPAPMVGDEARLIQVMMNLLNNAFAYTPRGGKVVLCVEPSDESVCLRVCDSGIGIAPEHQQRIFERFYRIDTARSRSDGGTGLGLSIVAWVVQKHRGTIRIDSAPGCGSVFTIMLPQA